MNQQDVLLFARISAINCEVEAMKCANNERELSGRSLAYNESEFWQRAEQIHKEINNFLNGRSKD